MTALQLGLDWERAEIGKEGGQRVALNHADAQWKDAARAAILTLAVSGREFVSDDVRRLVGDPPEGTSPNAMGALFSALAKEGRIRTVGFGRSARVIGHSNTVRIWKGC